MTANNMTLRIKIMIRSLSSMLACSFLLVACSAEHEARSDKEVNSAHIVQAGAIIPMPATVEVQEGYFTITNETPVIVTVDDGYVDDVVNMFTGLVAETTRLTLHRKDKVNIDGAIKFVLDPQFNIDGRSRSEGYSLDVNATGVVLKASNANGLMHAATSLWQLMTPKGEPHHTVTLAAQKIVDAPRYNWRGIMLDSARHYQSVEFIKSFIDWLAVHKFNVFHWHLIDDQGWRLEIKKYPRLTSVGAYRVQAGAGPREDIDPETGKPRLYGDYYTQEEIREIVAYAKSRFITVVPEIEMPGHAQALLAAYPEYGVTGEAIEIKTDWGVYENLYNVEEKTFDFIEDVLTETMDLFPSEYIHIGGDEAVKNQWQASPRIQKRMREFGVENEEELQSYFVRRVEEFLNKNGRKLVGWDEILEGGLSPNATVMSWRGIEGGIEAAKQGHDVVMTPGPLLYFDFAQSDLRDEPPGRPVPNIQTLEQIYAYNPIPEELTPDEAKHILGIQANIWTEHMRLEERVVHMMFPRIAAVAEVAWSDPDNKEFERFLNRLSNQLARYSSLGIAYADSAFQVKVTPTLLENGEVRLGLSNQTDFGEIHYTLNGSEPTLDSPIYSEPFTVGLPMEIRANSFYENAAIAEDTHRAFDSVSIAQREDDDLKTCTAGLPLRLEDDAPVYGERAVFNVDILNPCWIYEGADLNNVIAISASVGQLPFNFQVGDAIKNIKLPEPTTKFGEFLVKLDNCDGQIIASIPLEEAARNNATSIIQGEVQTVSGVHDLCLQFSGKAIDPFWVIDWVQPLKSH